MRATRNGNRGSGYARRAALAAACLILLPLAALGYLAAAANSANGAASSAPVRTVTNDNWSGYVAVACPSCALRYVAASWRVPAVDCSRSPAHSWAVAWAGLDGLTSGTVEQAGTYSICTDGRASYFAWWQMYPAVPSIFGAVRPGDRIAASVYRPPGSASWRLAVADSTAGRAWSASAACPARLVCADADADVVIEAPAAGPTLPLARFGAVSFSGIAVTSRNGTRGTMRPGPLWSARRVVLTGAGGRALAVPGQLDGPGRAFAVTWRAAS